VRAAKHFGSHAKDGKATWEKKAEGGSIEGSNGREK